MMVDDAADAYLCEAHDSHGNKSRARRKNTNILHRVDEESGGERPVPFITPAVPTTAGQPPLTVSSTVTVRRVGTVVILDGPPLVKVVTAGGGQSGGGLPGVAEETIRPWTIRRRTTWCGGGDYPAVDYPAADYPVWWRRLSVRVPSASMSRPSGLRTGSDEYRGPPLIRGYTRNSKLCRLPPGRVHYVASKAEWYLAD